MVILSKCSELISKTLIVYFKNKVCVYVSNMTIEGVTLWCTLIQTNPVFIEFLFWGPIESENKKIVVKYRKFPK